MGIRLTPAGRLRWESSADEAAPAGSPSLQSAFENDWREALFTLAADKIPTRDRPSVRYPDFRNSPMVLMIFPVSTRAILCFCYPLSL